MTASVLGIIGGSGVYDLDGLEDRAWVKIRTPWGDPSDDKRPGAAFIPGGAAAGADP